MPSLLEQAGLRGVRADYAGDTVIAAETIDAVNGDIARIAGAVLLANLLLLAIFLRGMETVKRLRMNDACGSQT